MYMGVVLINILVPQLGPPKKKFLAPPLHGSHISMHETNHHLSAEVKMNVLMLGDQKLTRLY